MKYRAYWICALTSAAVGAGILYFYGLSWSTLAIVLFVLICPVLVVWFTLRLAKRSEEEIDALMNKEAKSRHKK